MKLSTFLLIIIIAAWSHPSWAAKTDIVILQNGDRITGEIKKLEAGVLRVSTDHMGTINIEWRFIRRIFSDQNQTVEMIDGTRLVGTLVKGEEEADLIIKSDSGSTQVTTLDIVSAYPLGSDFKDRMTLDLSVGADYTSSTQLANASTAADFRLMNFKRIWESSLRTYLTRQGGDSSSDETSGSTTDQTRLEAWGSMERILMNQKYRKYSSKFERNEALDLDFRLSLGASFGRYLIKTNNQWFDVAIGLQALEERIRPPEDQAGTDVCGDYGEGPCDELNIETNFELTGTARYRYWRFTSPERSLDTYITLYPSITSAYRGRLRAESRTTFKLELAKDLFWSLELYGTFDNGKGLATPPDEKWDYGLTTSLGWSY
ncbi:MAG: DUF481 domain-containing protein [Lysobacterales bacterium]|jgi:hypothetical protein